MNVFTKDELEELLDGLEWKLGEGQSDELTIPLRDKLKSMIESYYDKCKTMWKYGDFQG